VPKREAARNPFKPKPRPVKSRKAQSPAPSQSLASRVPSVRVAALRRERDRLLREIGRKRRELERSTERVKETLRASRARIEPVLEKQRAVEFEVHALFEELFRRRGLSKQRRAVLARLYARLRAQGLVDEPPERSRPAPPESEDGDFAEGEPPLGGGYSAPRPDAEGGARSSLRAIFKRLALSLHPDRVQEEAEKARRTEAMKELTVAYESGDLARLLELEKRWADSSPSGSEPREDAEREAEKALERTVAELKRQLRELFDELKALRRSESYRVAEHLRRVAATGADPSEVFVAAAERDLGRLSDIKNCLHAFAAGRLSWEDLLSSAPWEEDAEEEDDFDWDD
jgi:hypothetical protein